MSGGLRLAQLGDQPGFEVAGATLGGHRFERHSHDEFVISANLRGEESVWLDGRTFDAGPGCVTCYNPGQIQGGGVAEDQPWQFVSLYVAPDQLAAMLGLQRLEFERPTGRLPALAGAMADAVAPALGDDTFVRQRGEERLTLLLAEIARAMGVRLPQLLSRAVGGSRTCRAGWRPTWRGNPASTRWRPTSACRVSTCCAASRSRWA